MIGNHRNPFTYARDLERDYNALVEYTLALEAYTLDLESRYGAIYMSLCATLARPKEGQFSLPITPSDGMGWGKFRESHEKSGEYPKPLPAQTTTTSKDNTNGKGKGKDTTSNTPTSDSGHPGKPTGIVAILDQTQKAMPDGALTRAEVDQIKAWEQGKGKNTIAEYARRLTGIRKAQSAHSA